MSHTQLQDSFLGLLTYDELERNWMARRTIEIYLPGSPAGPSPQAIALAIELTNELDTLRNKAFDFMRNTHDMPYQMPQEHPWDLICVSIHDSPNTYDVTLRVQDDGWLYCQWLVEFQNNQPFFATMQPR